MRVWIDISNSPQVLFFRPLVELLRERGHDVHVTTREYAQTTELLSLHGIPHEVVGPRHGGGSVFGKARALVGRLPALRSYAKGRSIDVAFSHASHELPLVARSLGIPSAYAFDYEFARVQHGLGSRAAHRVIVPDAIPQERLDRLGARASKVRRYAGIKEEYYLADGSPDSPILDLLGIDPADVLVVVRTPPEVSLYHRHGNPLFTDLLTTLDGDPTVRTVVLPRTSEQRAAIAHEAKNLVVPDRVLDGARLVAAADLVISAGGTMNREAAALGVPAYTTFAGELGAVDEMLVRDGRLHVLTSADGLELAKRRPGSAAAPRDPAILLDLLLSALA